jgi:hypothetical protein
MLIDQGSVVKHVDNLLVTGSGGTIRLEPKPDKDVIERILVVSSKAEESDNRQSPQLNDLENSPAQDTAISLELAEAKADLSRKTGDWSVYSFYIAATGRLDRT